MIASYQTRELLETLSIQLSKCHPERTSLPPFQILHSQKALSLHASWPLNLELDFLCNSIVKPVVDAWSFRKVRHDLSIKIIKHLIKFLKSCFHDCIISTFTFPGNFKLLWQNENEACNFLLLPSCMRQATHIQVACSLSWNALQDIWALLSSSWKFRDRNHVL